MSSTTQINGAIGLGLAKDSALANREPWLGLTTGDDKVNGELAWIIQASKRPNQTQLNMLARQGFEVELIDVDLPNNFGPRVKCHVILSTQDA